MSRSPDCLACRAINAPHRLSEVLSGKRRLALAQIQKLAAHFGVPADVFLAYPTVASLAGAAGSLKQPMSWDEMRDIAREDRSPKVRPQQ